MLHQIEEYGRVIEITGYRGVAFADAEAFLKANRSQTPDGVDIQFFDADLIATSEHLYFAVLNALAAFRGKTNISNSIAVETVLYTAAQRQIQKSIAKIGIKTQTKNMSVVIVGKDIESVEHLLGAVSAAVGSKPDDSVLELTEQKSAKIREVFNISQKELEAATRGTAQKALVDLVVERVALLATQI
jgi:tRNA threonylcarbamoyladenosine modification (KEOPS) complex Cgi121 subunit